MSKLTIDLSGIGGLAPKFNGDIDRTVATPNLRYIGEDNQMADGLYNPIRRYGYISPANATYADVVCGSALTTTLGSSQTWQAIGIAITPYGTTAPEYNGTASSGVEDTSDTSYTLSHTVGASLSGSILIVAVQHMVGAANPTGVTWNGTAMTLAVGATNNGFVSFWYLLSPTAGTANIVATWAANTGEKSIHAMTFTGASGINTTGTGYATSATASVSLNPTVINTMFVMATGSVNATHAPGSNQTERTDLVSGVTPYRYSTSTKASTITNLTSCVYDSVNNDFYIGGAGQQIWQGDGLDDTSLAQVLDLGATGTPVIYDLELYQINDVRKLFYVYETGGNLEIGEASLPFASANSNWLSTDVSGAFSNTLAAESYPFMRVSDNGFAYIFESGNIHKLDGTATGGATGKVSPNVLQFPAYFQIIDAVDYKGKLYIVVQQTTKVYTSSSPIVFNKEVGVYIWDRLSSVEGMRDYISLTGIREIQKIYISPVGDLRIMTVSSEGMTQIRRFNGSNFDIIEEVGYMGGIDRNLDALINTSNMTLWLAVDRHIYAHGKIVSNNNESIFKIGRVSETAGTTITPGMILFGGANTDSGTTGFKISKNGLYIGYKNSSGVNKAKEWDMYGTGADGVSAVQEQGDIYTLVKLLPQMSDIKYIDVYMIPGSGSGDTVQGTIKIYFNQSTTAWASKTITRTESALGYKRIEVNKSYINAIQFEIEYPTDVAIGTTDFAPSVAIVEYSPTKTKG